MYLPSLASGFRDDRLESAYQRYSHRQRQKSLIIVNGVDALLKIVVIVLLLVNYWSLGVPPSCNAFQDSRNDTDQLPWNILIQTQANRTGNAICGAVQPTSLDSFPVDSMTWTSCLIFANVVLCLLAWWRCFANNYLHWAAIATWMLMNFQGQCPLITESSSNSQLKAYFSVNINFPKN
jgi:adenylate cyclase 8